MSWISDIVCYFPDVCILSKSKQLTEHKTGSDEIQLDRFIICSGNASCFQQTITVGNADANRSIGSHFNEMLIKLDIKLYLMKVHLIMSLAKFWPSFSEDSMSLIIMAAIKVQTYHITRLRADSRFGPSQWEMALLCNDVYHWLGANLRLICAYVLRWYINSHIAIIFQYLDYKYNLTEQENLQIKDHMPWTLSNI